MIAVLFLKLYLYSYVVAGNYGAALQNIADPNFTGCSVLCNSVLQAKVGNVLTINNLAVGGFMEARNEPDLDHHLFPQNNWRGYISGTGMYPLFMQTQLSTFLIAMLEHESGYATMGVMEKPAHHFAMIYDQTDRKMVLNALRFGVMGATFDTKNEFKGSFSTGWYFLSKNTPEHSSVATANSVGMAFGGVYRRFLYRHLHGCIAVHGRTIFRSGGEHAGVLYVADPMITPVTCDYPALQQCTTIGLSCGITLPVFSSRQVLDFFINYMNGHPYGYADSRDIRSVVSIGFAVSGI